MSFRRFNCLNYTTFRGKERPTAGRRTAPSSAPASGRRKPADPGRLTPPFSPRPEPSRPPCDTLADSPSERAVRALGMRLGIFGGSFDPVHYGHLLLAECCRETLRLDEVWLIPAAVPPHKQLRELADGKHRLQMLELALGGHEQIRASAVELERGGISYTVDTLAAVRDRSPAAELFLLMGADSLHDLPNWREPARI